MDPNKTLEELRDLIKQWLRGPVNEPWDDEDYIDWGDTMVCKFEALDSWLTTLKGFKPTDWR